MIKAEALASISSGMWGTWQETVRQALPLFAKSPIYVEQASKTAAQFERVADERGSTLLLIDPGGKTRDVEFGGTVFETKAFGPVTRMWLDSAVEIDFLIRNLPPSSPLRGNQVLDIGAGYGRLAVPMSQHTKKVTCVDAVPVSTEVSREYCARFAPKVEVLAIGEFAARCGPGQYDLACNVHSWNECTIAQVQNWIEALVEMEVPYLFTVSHGTLKGPEPAYYTYREGQTGGPPYIAGPSYRPLLEHYYDLIIEESIGLDLCPHALWNLKQARPAAPWVRRTRPVVWIVTPQKQFPIEGSVDLNMLLDAVDPHFAEPIRELSNWAACPWNIQLMLTGGGGIYQARNVAATEFLENTSDPDDRLFFCDYDLIPKAQDYVDVLSHDLSIVGGLYTTRSDKPHWVLNVLPNARCSEKGILPVLELGSGFKCFKRRVFVKVLEDNPWLNCESDIDHRRRFYSFFSMGPVWDKKLWPGKGRGLTEDYWFDWLCRESGFITCAATKVKVRHLDKASGKIFPSEFPPDPGGPVVAAAKVEPFSG